MKPPAGDSLELKFSTFQPFESAYLQYILYRSAANRDASSPPVPARISTTVLRESVGFGGIIIRRISFFSGSTDAESDSMSSRAISASSGSELSSTILRFSAIWEKTFSSFL